MYRLPGGVEMGQERKMDDYENKLERLTILDGLFANFKMAERAGLLPDASDDCPQLIDIHRYHDGTLDEANRAKIKKHLGVCNRCLFRAVVYVRAKLERELGVDSESIQQQINDARERAKSKENFPGQSKGEMLVDHRLSRPSEPPNARRTSCLSTSSMARRAKRPAGSRDT